MFISRFIQWNADSWSTQFIVKPIPVEHESGDVDEVNGFQGAFIFSIRERKLTAT